MQVNAFSEAEVRTFTFVSDLCASVSDICRYMHGRSLSVDKAAAQLRAVEEASTPEALREIHPWVGRGKGDGGNDILYYRRGGVRKPIVEITDDGAFVNGLDTWALEDAGLLVPPLHGSCHSTIAVV